MKYLRMLASRAAQAIPAATACVFFTVLAAQAAVVAEGTYTTSAPEHRAVRFRMILTPTGARITPTQGETMIFSYEKKSALIVDTASRSYFLLPLEFVPALLSAGLGYEPRGLGASASGKTKTILGISCAEVTFSGKEPRFTLHSCRVTDPGWSGDYARLEAALGLPWAAADPPPMFTGLPLAGTLDIEGARPYRAAWVITKLLRDDGLGEDFVVPPGFRMDLERLLALQGSQR